MKFCFFIIFLLMAISSVAQESVIDSLKQVINKTNDDSTRFGLMIQISELYTFNNADSSIAYIKKAMTLAEDKNNSLWKAHANYAVSLYFFIASDFASALNFSFKNIYEYEKYHDSYVYALSTHMLASIYENANFHEKALSYAFKTIALLDTLHYVNKMYPIHFMNNKGKALTATYTLLAYSYSNLNKMDSALLYGQKANEVNTTEQLNWNYPLYILAIIYEKMDRPHLALSYYRRAVSMAIKENLIIDVVKNYIGIAELFKNLGRSDSTILYARKAIALEGEINYKRGVLDAALLLSEAFENSQMTDSAFHYYKYAMDIKDSLFSQEKVQQVQSIAFKEELKEQEQRQKAIIEETRYRNKIQVFIVLGIAAFLLSIAIILWRNNLQKQKANALLQQKNHQVEQTLVQLKSTQAQLMQSEKMASLGELTAGIAHEIQNPLNFVNNFSDLNIEMVDEATAEIHKGNIEEVKIILSDIRSNEEKINHHGKRADAIVKGMLQHSQRSEGKKEPTDLNALCDEYLRLSYHGLRAKDKTFNADFKTDFDESIGKINMIPQDIGRVLLNLYNNAFYAVNEKANASLRQAQSKPGSAGQANGYQPTAKVSTKRLNDRIEIRVEDNGNGIPASVVNKIFQPFFTTKPTGQGTGLGLSLCYDIIKAHGGEIKVESKEGEGSEFMIQLSIA